MIRFDAKNGIIMQCDICGFQIHSMDFHKWKYKKFMLYSYIKGLRLRRISGETIDTCSTCRKRKRV